MKSLIRSTAVNAVSLILVTQLVQSITVTQGALSYVTIAAILTALNLFVKPALELLFLPVNLLTLGAFRWISAVVIIWLTAVVTDQFSVMPYGFPGFSSYGVILPALTLSLPMTYVVIAFLFSGSSSLIHWLFR